jgi:hypothetical protein
VTLATASGPRPYTDTVASGPRSRSSTPTRRIRGEPAAVPGALVGPEVAEELAYAAAFADLAVAVAPAEV